MKTITTLIGATGEIVIAVLGLGWLGLQVRPRPFPAYAVSSSPPAPQLPGPTKAPQRGGQGVLKLA